MLSIASLEIAPSLTIFNSSPTKSIIVDSLELTILPPSTKTSISGNFVLISFESKIDF